MNRFGFLLAASFSVTPLLAEEPLPPPVGSSPFTPGVQNNQSVVPRDASPFTPGVQNQNPGYYQGPYTPGTQNAGTAWNNNGTGGNAWNGGGSTWSNGGSTWQNNAGNGWQTYQPPQRYTYTRPQSQYPSNSYPSNSYPSNSYPSGSYPSNSYPSQPSYNSNTYPSTPGYTPPVTYSGEPIHISMPGDQYGTCAYTLASGADSWTYTMIPGKSQKFAEDRSWQITFDRGNGYGQQSYRLIPGYYRFRQSAQGWELYHSKTPPAPTGGNAPPPPS